MPIEQLIVAAAAAAVHARDHEHSYDSDCPGHDIEVICFGPVNAKWFCHCHGLESNLMPRFEASHAAHDHAGHAHRPRTIPAPRTARPGRRAA